MESSKSKSDQIDFKTRLLQEKSEASTREAGGEIVIQDYLNRTFDEINKNRGSSTNQRAVLGAAAGGRESRLKIESSLDNDYSMMSVDTATAAVKQPRYKERPQTTVNQNSQAAMRT